MTSAPWFLLNEFPPRRWMELFIGLIQFRHPESFPQTNGVRTCYAGAASAPPCVRCDATIPPAGNTLSDGCEAPRETNEDIINNSFLTVNNYQRNWNLFRLLSAHRKSDGSAAARKHEMFLHKTFTPFPMVSAFGGPGLRRSEMRGKIWIINIVITIIHIFPRYTGDAERES